MKYWGIEFSGCFCIFLTFFVLRRNWLSGRADLSRSGNFYDKILTLKNFLKSTTRSGWLLEKILHSEPSETPVSVFYVPHFRIKLTFEKLCKKWMKTVRELSKNTVMFLFTIFRNNSCLPLFNATLFKVF